MKFKKIMIRPSQWVNLGWFLLAVASWYFAFTSFEVYDTSSDTGGYVPYDSLGYSFNWWIGIPFTVIWLWRMLVISCWRFYFDSETDTIIEKKGVFSINTLEIHYFRIKSIRVWRPFLLRIFGLSTVEIVTSEPFQPYLRLYAIYRGYEWAEYLKNAMTHWREVKGLKETDFHAF